MAATTPDSILLGPATASAQPPAAASGGAHGRRGHHSASHIFPLLQGNRARTPVHTGTGKGISRALTAPVTLPRTHKVQVPGSTGDEAQWTALAIPTCFYF